jgi:hypothetical protein
VLLLLLGCSGKVEECEPLAASASMIPDLPMFSELTEIWPGERGPGLALADLDADGWLDLVLALPTGSSRIYRNDGTGELLPASALVDGRPLPSANGVAADDLNNDGVTDLVLTTQHGSPDAILYGLGGLRYTARLLPDSLGEAKTPSLADFDADGDLDLFISGFVPDANGALIAQGKQVSDGSRLYRQDDGIFVSQALPEGVLAGLNYQGIWLDAEQDGDLDLYLTNDHGNQAQGNRLLRGDGSGGLTLDEDCDCNITIDGMGGDITDVNDDGLPDIFLADDGNPHLLLSVDGDGFADAAAALSLLPDRDESGVSWGCQFADFDADGRDDLAVAFGELGREDGSDPGDREDDRIFLANPDGTFTDASAAVGFDSSQRARSLVVGDLDRDGRPEVVIGGRLFVRIWTFSGGCPPGVTLQLDGPPGNPHGLGARVDVDLADRRTTRWLAPSSTYGASAPELYLGTGGEPVISKLTVTWPDGTQSMASDIEAGTIASVAY